MVNKGSAAGESSDFSIDRELRPDGSFSRQESRFRDLIPTDGEGGHQPEPGRYHLWISWACPWAHRTAIARNLKGLCDVITMSAVDPIRDARGWAFTGGEYTDPIGGFDFLSQAYAATDPRFDQRVTVPVLWDRETGTIVNNESADILRILNRGFGELADTTVDLCPDDLVEAIDVLNADIYDRLNNGVYKAGFATSQQAYDDAVTAVFDCLDGLEDRLSGQRYLLGERMTEADVRLFTTLVRFDAVYVGHFKCNVRRLIDYPSLWGWTRDLFQTKGIGETVRLDEIKAHYYRTHPQINPTGIVPAGPELDFTAPHGREGL